MNTIPVRTQNIKLGVFYGVIAAFAFALMSVFVKQVGQQLPTSMLIFFRFGVSLMLLLPCIFRSSQFTLKITTPVRYMIRILCALVALFCVFYAIKFIPLVDALLLSNTTPLFVPIIVWLLVGAKIPKKASLGIILGFVGIALILNPGKEIFSLPALIALFAGGLAALAIVQLRLISKVSSTQQMLFYYFSVSTLVSGVIAVIQWQAPASLHVWLLLICIGIFGAGYQIFSTLAYVIAPVRLMSPLLFLTVVFGGCFDWLLWNNIPTILTIVGCVITILGAMITIYFGHAEIKKSSA